MQKGTHTQYNLQFHVVWITKYRKKILVGKIVSRLKVLLMQGYSAKGITIIKGNIQPEHVHLLISIPPSLSIAQVMQYLKGRSSKKIARRIFVVEEAILGSTYVGDWVFCTSVGKVTQDTIIEYIESQKDDIDDIFVKDGML